MLKTPILALGNPIFIISIADLIPDLSLTLDHTNLKVLLDNFSTMNREYEVKNKINNIVALLTYIRDKRRI